jgi:NADH-quinone oxidoreductase subunit C
VAGSASLAATDIIDRLRARFGDDVPEAEEHHGHAVVRVAPERYRELVTTLRDDPELRFDFFDFLSAVDRMERGLDVILQLFSTAHNHHVRVKVGAGTEEPHCASIHDLYGGADWCERETWELFGVVFEGHPQLVRLVLPEQFEGHPGRKDFRLMSRVAKPWPGRVEGEEEEEDQG